MSTIFIYCCLHVYILVAVKIFILSVMGTFKTPDKYKLSVQPGGVIVSSQLRDANLLDTLKSEFFIK